MMASERQTTTAQQWKQHLVDLFTEDHSRAAKVIAAGELHLAADNTHDLLSVPTWHKEPIIILGDAAHAPSATSG